MSYLKRSLGTIKGSRLIGIEVTPIKLLNLYCRKYVDIHVLQSGEEIKDHSFETSPSTNISVVGRDTQYWLLLELCSYLFISILNKIYKTNILTK